MTSNPPRPALTRGGSDATSVDVHASSDGATGGPCRFCGAELRHIFVDLGMSPLCESYVEAARVNAMEAFYPLRVYVCERCFLVQLQEYVAPEDIFTEYAYFSSYSDSWLRHCRDYVDMITERLVLGADSLVVELASNDGYLLQWFVGKGIPVLGIEPAVNVAKVAEDKGVPTLTEFFGAELASKLVGEGTRTDLIIGNNVLAQVPDLNSFVAGIATLLGPDGVVTIEFPHLQRLVEGNQLDTIYHEHFSYFSLVAAERIFAAHGLRIFDVDELWTHGGSLRIYGATPPANAGGSRRPWRRCGGANERAATRRSPPTQCSRNRHGRPSGSSSVTSSRPSGPARPSSATALPARATHSSTTVASAPTSSTSPWTAIPTSRGGSCRAATSPSMRRRRSPRSSRT